MNPVDPSDYQDDTPSVPPPFSLADLLRQHARDGSSRAAQLLRAGEAILARGAPIFRSLAYLGSDHLSAGPAAGMLHSSPSPEQQVFRVDLRDWIAPDELLRRAPWAGETLQIHCCRVTGGDRLRFVATLPSQPPPGVKGDCLHVELQGVNGATGSVSLSPSSYSEAFLEDDLVLDVNDLGYRIQLEDS